MAMSRLPTQVVNFLSVPHNLIFFEFVFNEVHTEGKALFRDKLLKLGEGFLSEGAELHHISNLQLNQVAEGLDIGSLEAVVGTNGEIEIVEGGLQQLTHAEQLFINLFDFAVFAGFNLN